MAHRLVLATAWGSLVGAVLAVPVLALYGVAIAQSEPHCYAASTEDSDPYRVPCDYRNGAWHPVTGTVYLPPCDDDQPGQPVTGPCWLADGDQVAIWPRPYATEGPLAVLRRSQ